MGENLDVLLLVRADTLRSHAGQPAFPGGKIDPEDYALARQQGVSVGRIAALREAVEETGLDPAGVEILGELPTLPLAVSDFRVTPVLGWWASPTRVGVVDTNESALIARVPVRDLLNPANRHTAYVKRGRITHKTRRFEVVPALAAMRGSSSPCGGSPRSYSIRFLMRSVGRSRGMLRCLNLRPHPGKQPLTGA